MIHSLAGALPEGGLVTRRPFRDPHHGASGPAIIGGGGRAKPGEGSLAHRGVLFLDELPEVSRQTLEALRQPVETGTVTVARANAHVTYPARFQLVAAMNPCRCGYLGDGARDCGRAPRCGREYQAKISGPLYDRIDLTVDVPPVVAADLSLPASGERSIDVAARVAAAREVQRERYDGFAIATNAEAVGQTLEDTSRLTDTARALLAGAAEEFRMTARGYHRTVRVARTIADLDRSAAIQLAHMSEAISFRRRPLAEERPRKSA